jgi:hypothetical protein
MNHPKFTQRNNPEDKSIGVTPDGLSVSENVLRTSIGNSLDKWAEEKMNKVFNRSFDNVQVHTDDKAAQYVNQIDPNAQAFTYQNHIFFAPGQYQPNSGQGLSLIAHELTHMMQGASLPSLGGRFLSGLTSKAHELEGQAQGAESLVKEGLGSLSHINLPNVEASASASMNAGPFQANMSLGANFTPPAANHFQPGESIRKMAGQQPEGEASEGEESSSPEASSGQSSSSSASGEDDIHGAIQSAVRQAIEEFSQRSQWDAQRRGVTGRSDTLDFG